MKNVSGILLFLIGTPWVSFSTIPLIASIFGLAKLDSFLGSGIYIIFSLAGLGSWYGGLTLLEKGTTPKKQRILILIVFIFLAAALYYWGFKNGVGA